MIKPLEIKVVIFLHIKEHTDLIVSAFFSFANSFIAFLINDEYE